MLRNLLFVGIESFNWTLAQFDSVINLCKQHGYSGALIKVYESTQGLWYQKLGGFKVVQDHFHAAGLDCVPYGFMYGGSDISAEARVGWDFLNDFGIYCADMESGFDGDTRTASILAQLWANHPGELWVSCWANVADHNWLGVISLLDSITAVWMPQVYSDSLATRAKAQWPKVKGWVCPTLHISSAYGANNPASHVGMFGSGHLSVWEYQQAVAWPTISQDIVNTWKAKTMVTLSPYPLVNQRTIKTADGRPSENKDYGCVYSALLSAVFHHHPELIGTIVPDQLKDDVLGEAYTGGTDIRSFISWANAHGVDVTLYNGGTHQAAIAEAHRQLSKGNPSIFTQQDDYSSNPGYTHVCGFYGETPGGLIAHDPFGANNGDVFAGKSISYSDATWASRLRSNELWIVSNRSMVQLTVNSPVIRDFFVTGPQANTWARRDGKKDSDGNLIILKGRILQKYSTGVPGYADFGLLTIAGLPISNEKNYQYSNNVVVYCEQECERGVLVYDAGNAHDHPPGASDVYLRHIEGLYPLVTLLQQALDALKPLQDDIAKMKEQIAQLQAELAAGVKPYADIILQAAKLVQDAYPVLLDLLKLPPQ